MKVYSDLILLAYSVQISAICVQRSNFSYKVFGGLLGKNEMLLDVGGGGGGVVANVLDVQS